MLFELGLVCFGVLAITIAIAIFFYAIASAPEVARNIELSARYAGLEKKTKLVRFW